MSLRDVFVGFGLGILAMVFIGNPIQESVEERERRDVINQVEILLDEIETREAIEESKRALKELDSIAHGN